MLKPTAEHIKNIKKEIESKLIWYGYEKVLKNLQNTDFFIAPASTRFHDSFESGLIFHTFKVYMGLKSLNEKLALNFKDEQIFKVSLAHDFCKIDTYKIEMRNTKNELGEWVKVPYYTYDDSSFPYGHGEKSVQLTELYGLDLSLEEKMAVRWHMGGFDASVKGGYNISNVFDNYKLALYLHIADMLATYDK